mgnify:CR=1 FL=1
MANVPGKIVMKVITIAVGLPVTIVTKRVVEKVWVAANPDDPPRSAKQDGVAWSDALAWAALSATAMVVADLVTRKSAASTYRVLTGVEPPPQKSKAAKKAAKAQAKIEL